VSRSTALRPLAGGEVLTFAEAVEQLGGRRETARAWLRDHDLVRPHGRLGERVVWSEVLDQLRLSAPNEPEDEPPRARLPRAGIAPRRR
jgi:hypothetical protein